MPRINVISWFIFVIGSSCLHCFSSSVVCDLKVDTGNVVNTVEPFFLSFCIDSSMFEPSIQWHGFNFSSRKLHTLLESMSPAVLRIGGGEADYLFFDIPMDALNSSQLKPSPVIMTKQDVVNLVELTRSTKNRLLFDFNLQVRYGYQWDPSNAIMFLEFCKLKNYGDNLDFELGNEPEYLIPELITPKLVAVDFQILRRVIRHYPLLNKSSIVGPDVVSTTGIGLEYLRDVVDSSGDFLRATTFHHYYFRGDTSDYKEYLNPGNFYDLERHILVLKNVTTKSKFPSIDLWIGETSDSWHQGTANVSDRFVSGFLWLEKLGLSALMGVKVVMKQTLFGGNYGLLDQNLNPNPDFWLTWIHKRLVGKRAFHVRSTCSPSDPKTFRVYSHCTRSSSLYKAGSLTLFALNMDAVRSVSMRFGDFHPDEQLKQQQHLAHIYLVQSGDDFPNGRDFTDETFRSSVLSKFCRVNGELMKMPSDSTMPKLKPRVHDPRRDFDLPPLSLLFVVFPGVRVEACLDE